MLRTWRERSRRFWIGHGYDLDDALLVFPDETGTWRAPHTVNRALARICRDAGIRVIPPHWLRHSGISVSRLDGEDIVTISRRAGHRDIRTTLAIYSHTLEVEHERLGRSFGSKLDD